MTKNDLLTFLKKQKPILKDKFGIEEIALFGSFAREEANHKSDIDIAIMKASKKDFFLRQEAIQYLESQLHKEVDMGYFSSMHTFIKNRIEKELIRV